MRIDCPECHELVNLKVVKWWDKEKAEIEIMWGCCPCEIEGSTILK